MELYLLEKLVTDWRLVVTYLKCPLFCTHQYVEDIQTKLPPMSEELKDKIDDLSQEIQDRNLAEKVSQAESHAAQLNDSSAVLDGYVICCRKCLCILTLVQKL